MTAPPNPGESFPRLVALMQRLLAPGGCPWDQEQTLESLRPYLIEEAYEVCEAIDRGDAGELRKELGDLLLQIVFQSEIARRKGWFGPDDVISAICEKLERRHPHVFGSATAETAAAVHQNWERIKENERRPEQGLLDGVPPQLPALLQAARITEKAAQVGFDWARSEDVRHKLNEELEELDRACQRQASSEIEEEIGDVLFTMVNLARKLGVAPEDALRGSIRKFRRRFGWIEGEVKTRGLRLSDCSLEVLDELWERAKTELAK